MKNKHDGRIVLVATIKGTRTLTDIKMEGFLDWKQIRILLIDAITDILQYYQNERKKLKLLEEMK